MERGSAVGSDAGGAVHSRSLKDSAADSQATVAIVFGRVGMTQAGRPPSAARAATTRVRAYR